MDQPISLKTDIIIVASKGKYKLPFGFKKIKFLSPLTATCS